MPLGMDIFGSSAFHMVTLTAAVNDVPYVPGQVSSLGLFEEQGVRTTTIAVERQGQQIALVPSTPRGGPGIANQHPGRNILPLSIPHLQLNDAVYADEVQGVRAFGSESEFRTVQQLVNDRNAQMARKLDLTMEYHRLGALKGIVLDADGATTLFNFFTLFGEAAPAVIDWDLDNATPASGVLRLKAAQVIRYIAEALGGVPYARIHALVGSTFMDQLVTHAEFRETHIYRESQVLRAEIPYTQVQFGGITFEEYRGPASGPAFIAAGDARFFPIGVPGLFITRFAPADYEETVNTIGLPRYAIQRPETAPPVKRQQLEVQTNPIHICTRPRVLVRGTNT